MNYLLRIVFCIICFILSFTDKGSQYSDKIFYTSLVIQFFCVWFIFSWEKMPFSLNKMFYLFSLLFFGIAPLFQYQHNVSLWGWNPLSEDNYFAMNIIIIIILILYQTLYTILFLKSSDSMRKRTSNIDFNYVISSQKVLKLIFLSGLSFLITFYARNFNFLALLYRGGEFSEYIIKTQSQMLVIEYFVRPISMMCLLVYLMCEQKKPLFSTFILLVLALLTCMPTGMPRFAAAALYIPLLICSAPMVRRKNIFPVIFLAGFLFIFPLLNIFRVFTSDSKVEFSISNTEMFLQGDFDSYYNFAIIVSHNIVTFGRQLLGVLLFWVPRNIWANKPEGSGTYIADQLGMSFSNISANFFAEGYINFGMVGIFGFTIILAIVTAIMDAKNFFDKSKSIFFRMVYLLLIGLLFFILRGDLLSSFAYTIGYITAAFAVVKIVNSQKVFKG